MYIYIFLIRVLTPDLVVYLQNVILEQLKIMPLKLKLKISNYRPFPIPQVAIKPPPPAAIPEAWQKANEALQAVKQTENGSKETVTVKTEPASTATDFSNNYEWSNSYPAYPG